MFVDGSWYCHSGFGFAVEVLTDLLVWMLAWWFSWLWSLEAMVKANVCHYGYQRSVQLKSELYHGFLLLLFPRLKVELCSAQFGVHLILMEIDVSAHRDLDSMHRKYSTTRKKGRKILNSKLGAEIATTILLSPINDIILLPVILKLPKSTHRH
ncbi:hypothetical protein B0T14DRAFT_260285 [Immersiella caudata]|uniref:Uncharacterized protein n=1 Tax=Immersiella caudata TaxID=314043 RepID=A0AA39WKR1_9PEZI|nr:hypothetical protein B0T14DRAFT_260285 [Immersiella caudata]